MNGYPRWFLPLLLALLAAVLASGLGLTPTTLVLRAEWELPWKLAGGDRVWVAALHAAAAFVLATLAGALWSVHMRSGWRRRRQRVSGLLLGTALGGLMASAVGLYYLGDERWAAVAAYLHLALGALATAVFAWHFVHGRHARQAG